MFKKSKNVLLSIIVSTLFITACNQLVQNPLEMRQIRTCQSHCLEKKNQCQKVCDDDCRKCQYASVQHSARHYNEFKKEQCVRGGVISRELQSYQDPLQCRKTSCDCEADYHVCKQSCKGVIHKDLKIAPGCC